MLERKDLLMAQLVAGMMMGLQKTTAMLEQALEGQADLAKANELIKTNKKWLAKVKDELGLDHIF